MSNTEVKQSYGANVLMNGTYVLIEREPRKAVTDSGILLPDTYNNDKRDVGTVERIDPYQKKGRILAIGIDCSESFKENFKVGDMVHFAPGSFDVAILDKDTLTIDPKYIITDSYSIHWKEVENA